MKQALLNSLGSLQRLGEEWKYARNIFRSFMFTTWRKVKQRLLSSWVRFHLLKRNTVTKHFKHKKLWFGFIQRHISTVDRLEQSFQISATFFENSLRESYVIHRIKCVSKLAYARIMASFATSTIFPVIVRTLRTMTMRFSAAIKHEKLFLTKRQTTSMVKYSICCSHSTGSNRRPSAQQH